MEDIDKIHLFLCEKFTFPIHTEFFEVDGGGKYSWTRQHLWMGNKKNLELNFKKLHTLPFDKHNRSMLLPECHIEVTIAWRISIDFNSLCAIQGQCPSLNVIVFVFILFPHPSFSVLVYTQSFSNTEIKSQTSEINSNTFFCF